MSPSLPLPAPSLSLTSKTHIPFFSPPLLKSPSFLLLPLPFSYFPSLTCHCSNTSNSSSDREEQRWLREEQRWLREEQRWLREEQRWLREEQRWLRERDSLLRQISDLTLQVQALERRLLEQELASSDAVGNVAALLQALKDKNLVLESGSNSQQQRMVLVEKEEKNEREEEVIEHEKEVVVVEEAATRVEKRSTLRRGSEGEEVREMQEALLKLGFYSGEEDIEFSSFSSGTESAVKTWQAGLGATEDGIMTSELLERLYLEIRIKEAGNADESKSSTTVSSKEGENGAVVASMTEISEVQQKVVRKEDTGIEASQRGVFLLGENRWEEPSRLAPRDGLDRSKKKDATKKCLQCRGEGRLLCTECDGSGEPNIEPQFLEWVDEGTKCPYCEGLGYTICDVCGGKTMV